MQKHKEKEESQIASQLLYRYIPYWPVFLLFFALAGAGGWLFIKHATPLYETSARILIKDEKKGSEDAQTIEELNHLSDKKIIENESEVIRSRVLISKVVNDLGLYAPIYEEQRLKNAAAYTTAPITIRAQIPDSVKDTKKVPFQFRAETGTVQIGKNSYPMNKWVNAGYGQMMFVRNVHQKSVGTGKMFFTLRSPESVVAEIQGGLKAEPPTKQSSILNLTLRDEVPERAEDILNGLMEAYTKAAMDDKNTLATNTITFLDHRLNDVEQDLKSIEKQNQQYRADQQAIDISEQGRLFLQNVSTNDQKLSDINMQVAVLGQVEAYVKSRNSSASIIPSTLGVSDPVLAQLVSKLYSYEIEYESLKKTNAENNPTMLSLVDRMEKIRPGILENIQGQRRSLEASKNNLVVTNGAYTSMIRTIPEKERRLIEINREQGIKNGIYGYLLQKREDIALSHAATLSGSRIVDRAQSSDAPVSPKRKVIYLTAFLIALFAGIGAVSAKESLGRRIMFRHQIEKLTEQPIIGEIASVPGKETIVIGSGKKTFIAEQFRKLRTTLPHIGIGGKRKRILVTSSISGEGKSFVATNLALSLALTGKRVVLVDGDLNNPSLHTKLSIGGGPGLTEYLLGELEMDDVVRPSGLDPMLSYISTGRLPENPSELIMHERMEELMNHLDAAFDYVIVDTAPVVPVSDAYTLSPLCDATLFVVRHQYTPKIFVQRIDEDNKINQLNNIAIVFNGIRSRGFGSKNYGYGYGYGYIYKDERLRISNT